MNRFLELHREGEGGGNDCAILEGKREKGGASEKNAINAFDISKTSESIIKGGGENPLLSFAKEEERGGGKEPSAIILVITGGGRYILP